MRRFALLLAVVFVATGAHAQAVDQAGQSPAPAADPKIDVRSATIPSAADVLQPSKKPVKADIPNDPAFSGLDLGRSKLILETERKPLDTQIGAETFEPGTLTPHKSSRKSRPTFFGLSVKTAIE